MQLRKLFFQMGNLAGGPGFEARLTQSESNFRGRGFAPRQKRISSFLNRFSADLAAARPGDLPLERSKTRFKSDRWGAWNFSKFRIRCED